MQYYSYNMGDRTVPPPYGAAFQKPKVDNSRLWFAAAVPVIALYAENYAINIYLGVIVWCCAFVSVWIGCFLDKRYLDRLGFDTEKLTPVSIVLAPIYFFRRLKVTGSQPTTGIVFCMLLGYAVLFNGFTASLNMTEDSYVSQVKQNYWMNIEGFSEASGLTYIGDSLDTYSTEKCGGEELTWSAALDGETVYVTAISGNEESGYDLRLNFSVEYDGYAFGSITVTDLWVNGERYEDDELTEKLVEIINYESAADSSANESQTPNRTESIAEAKTA